MLMQTSERLRLCILRFMPRKRKRKIRPTKGETGGKENGTAHPDTLHLQEQAESLQAYRRLGVALYLRTLHRPLHDQGQCRRRLERDAARRENAQRSITDGLGHVKAVLQERSPEALLGVRRLRKRRVHPAERARYHSVPERMVRSRNGNLLQKVRGQVRLHEGTVA